MTKEESLARVVVGCQHGSESPDAVVVAYLTAGAALDRGDDVCLWLTSEGVRLALDGYVAPIREGMEPPVQRVHDQFIEKGGRFYVCPICFNDRQLNESDLVQNAELKGATPLMEFVGDGATVFNY
jgi:predicted peroxiredoxin